MAFSQLLLAHWDEAASLTSQKRRNVKVDGHSLRIADVVAVARHLQHVELTEEALKTIIKCSGIVDQELAEGKVVYGVNTGFGGSADTRTSDVKGLQRSLLTGLHCGVLSPDEPHSISNSQNGSTILPVDSPANTTRMIDSWVRASMLVRLNSFAVGASGIQDKIATTVAELLNRDIVPCIPLRGSISASGDLSPLSYIGGLLIGSPAIAASTGGRKALSSSGSSPRKVVPADVALRDAGIRPIELQAKEGLAIVNGTSVSAGVAALAVHETLHLAGLAQILTTMTVEALAGHRESFDPFIARVRPHEGQVDAAHNMFAFLADSKLTARNSHSMGEHELAQDRYSLRTSSQWIGPVLEDLGLAHAQITTELNSATDNPLIDADARRILHGGNFQAKSVTVAVEKLRQGLQSLGRMLFAQCSELINPAMNRGLPPNLAIDEPSESFLFKPTDILLAALTSELGFLANPVGSHVQTAEMGNQAINSLALISTRYTMEAIAVFSQLAAAHLLAVCHGLDLRVMHNLFLQKCRPVFVQQFEESFPRSKIDQKARDTCWSRFVGTLASTTNYDSAQRFREAAQSVQPVLLSTTVTGAPLSVEAINAFTTSLAKATCDIFIQNRDTYRRKPDAEPYLGRAAKRVYRFVRKDLGVPLFGEAEVAPPTDPVANGAQGLGTLLRGEEHKEKMTASIGAYSAVVYEAIRDGRLYAVVAGCVDDAQAWGVASDARGSKL